MPPDCGLHIVAFRGLGHSGIAQSHQLGDAAPMVDHALAPHFGRVGGEHRYDQRPVQQVGNRLVRRSLGREPCKRSASVAPGSAATPCRSSARLASIEKSMKPRTKANVSSRLSARGRDDRLPGRRRDTGRPRPSVYIRSARTRPRRHVADHVAEQPAEIANVGILLGRPCLFIGRFTSTLFFLSAASAGRPCFPESGSHSRFAARPVGRPIKQRGSRGNWTGRTAVAAFTHWIIAELQRFRQWRGNALAERRGRSL